MSDDFQPRYVVGGGAPVTAAVTLVVAGHGWTRHVAQVVPVGVRVPTRPPAPPSPGVLPQDRGGAGSKPGRATPPRGPAGAPQRFSPAPRGSTGGVRRERPGVRCCSHPAARASGHPRPGHLEHSLGRPPQTGWGCVPGGLAADHAGAASHAVEPRGEPVLAQTAPVLVGDVRGAPLPATRPSESQTPEAASPAKNDCARASERKAS